MENPYFLSCIFLLNCNTRCFDIRYQNQCCVVQTTNIIRSIRYSTWISFFIRENMSEPLTLSTAENKLNELNKNIVEIKKKVQLSGNDSNCIKYFSFIYITSDNNPWVDTIQGCKARIKSYLYRASYFSTVLFINDILTKYNRQYTNS